MDSGVGTHGCHCACVYMKNVLRKICVRKASWAYELCCTKGSAESMPRAKIQIGERLTMLRMSERRSNGLDLAQNSFWRRRILPGRTPTYEKDDLCECLAVQMNSKLGYAYARHHERMLCSAPNQGCARNTYVSPAKRMAAEASTGNMTNF